MIKWHALHYLLGYTHISGYNQRSLSTDIVQCILIAEIEIEIPCQKGILISSQDQETEKSGLKSKRNSLLYSIW